MNTDTIPTPLQVLEALIENADDPYVVEAAQRRRGELMVDMALKGREHALQLQAEERQQQEEERRRNDFIRRGVEIVHNGVHDTESRKPIVPSERVEQEPVETPSVERRGITPEEAAKLGVSPDDMAEVDSIIAARQEPEAD